MLSDNFIKYIIDNANANDLKVFVKEVINSIKSSQEWNFDILSANALELICGAKKPYTKDDVDIDKCIAYIKSNCYKGENVEVCKLISVDNINLDCYLEYTRSDDSGISKTHIRLEDVLK